MFLDHRASEIKVDSIDLRWGWIFLEQTRILSVIQLTTHFVDFVVVETKRFVSITLNVILTRQTSGLRSSRAAEANTER